MAERRREAGGAVALRPYAQMSATERSSVRYAAELYYTNDVLGCITPTRMAELPQFRHLAAATLEQWCAKGNWPAIRREKQERIKAGIEHRVSQQIMQAQVRQLETLERLYQRSMAFALSKQGPPPRSFEGAARVALGASKHMTEMRLAMAESLLPHAAPEQQAPSAPGAPGALDAMLPDEVLPTLTDEDARALAHQLLTRPLRDAAAQDAPGDAEDGAAAGGEEDKT